MKKYVLGLRGTGIRHQEKVRDCCGRLHCSLFTGRKDIACDGKDIERHGSLERMVHTGAYWYKDRRGAKARL